MSTSSSKFSSLSSSNNFNFDLPSISSISTIARQNAGVDQNVKTAKKKRPDNPILSMTFCIVMQSAIVALIFSAIWIYFKHDWVISAAYLSAASQSLLGIILIMACCTCLQSNALNAIALLAVVLVGLTEFVMVVYVSIMDELHQCNSESECQFFGNTEEKYTYVILHAAFSVIHGIFIGIFCVRLSAKSKLKQRSVVAHPQKLPTQSATQQNRQQKQLETHPDKKCQHRSKSFHSSRASSSKASSKAAYRIPRHPRSRSLSTRSYASTQFPENSSMQSNIPPMRLQTTMSTHHCPIASNYCNIPQCPHYHQQQYQQQPSMTSQPNYQLVPYRPPPPQQNSLPVYPNYLNTQDPSRTIVIDLPQRNDAAQNNVGVIEIQRFIINIPQLYQNQAQQQQPPRSDAPPSQSRQPQENV